MFGGCEDDQRTEDAARKAKLKQALTDHASAASYAESEDSEDARELTKTLLGSQFTVGP